MATVHLLSIITLIIHIHLSYCFIACSNCNNEVYPLSQPLEPTLPPTTISDTTSNPTTNPIANPIDIPYIFENGNLIPLYIPNPTTYPTSTPSIAPISNKQTYMDEDKYNDKYTNQDTNIGTDKLCFHIGEQCNNELTCCDGNNNGNIHCKYNTKNNTISDNGICCVMHNKSGCMNDYDCCNSSDVCSNFVCTQSNHTDIYMHTDIPDRKIDLYNISNRTANVKTRKALFPTELFFVFILIPIVVMMVFGIIYKWYMNIKYKKKCNEKNKSNNNNNIKYKSKDVDKKGGGKENVMRKGYFGNDLEHNDDLCLDDDDTNDDSYDSDETPIPASFSMKGYLL